MDTMDGLNNLVKRQQVASSRGTSNSLSTVFSTLIPTLIVAGAVFAIFLLLRSKLPRVYGPRSLYRIVNDRDQTPPSNDGLFGWVANYRSLSDSHVLQHQSLDGYLFLRFLRLLTILSIVGCCITWPILFPVNGTGGGGQQQLDVVSFSNVVPGGRYFAHAIITWIYLGIVVLLIARERLFFVGLRQAYFLSTFHAQRLSSRTVLFMDIPTASLSEAALRKIFGKQVRKVWLVADHDDLEEKVKERDKLWNQFEKAETTVMTKADKKRLKSGETTSTDPYKFVEEKFWPSHKLKPIIGKKVPTINYGQTELPKMQAEIEKLRTEFHGGRVAMLSAAFVEFDTQAAAQEAFQIKAQDKMTEWNPRYIGVDPNEVIWKNLGTSYESRKTKMLIATAIIVVMTIFWAVPVAFVGTLSNINYLTQQVPFLSFINNIPAPILGLVTGLLPVLLLAVLMALVPVICRLLAKLSGAPTLSEVESKTQSWYFIFQVIQVFLVTTFTSGASSVAGQIVSQPASAVSLLAQNLPKASNFYMSYFVIQCLMASALTLLNLVPFLMITILGSIVDKSPRKKYNRWMTLKGVPWGSIYPKITNLGVIALSYSCIAPLVLLFSSIGFALLYLGHRYNFLFVYGIRVNMKGESFARALRQLMTGVYLAIVCLLGLFSIGTATAPVSAGPMVLMIILLIVVAVFQFVLDRALGPLEQKLPLDLLMKNEESVTTAARVEEGKHGQEGLNEREGLPQRFVADSTAAHPERKPNVLTRWIKPQVERYRRKGERLLASSNYDNLDPHYYAEQIDNAYVHPAVADDELFIWLPHDGAGLSEAMLQKNKDAGMNGSNKAAWLNDKSKVEWDRYNPYRAPIYEEAKAW